MTKKTPTNRRSIINSIIDRRDILQNLLGSPKQIRIGIILILYIFTTVSIAIWSTEQLNFYSGQIASETRLFRMDVNVPDPNETNALKKQAQAEALEVFRIENSYLEQLEERMKTLPKSLGEAESIDQVDKELSEALGLDENGLIAFQEQLEQDTDSVLWRKLIKLFFDKELSRYALLNQDAYSKYQDHPALQRGLHVGNGKIIAGIYEKPLALPKEKNLSKIKPQPDVEEMFKEDFHPTIAKHLRILLYYRGRPTMQTESSLSQQLKVEAAEKIEPVNITSRRGDLIWQEGDIISFRQLEQAKLEQEQFLSNASWNSRWQPRIGIGILIAILILIVFTIAYLSSSKSTENPIRILFLSLTSTVLLLIPALTGSEIPAGTIFMAFLSTAMITTIARVTYDFKHALVIGTLQSLLISITIELTFPWVTNLIAASLMCAISLQEFRRREVLIKAGFYGSLLAFLGGIASGLFINFGAESSMGSLLWPAFSASAGTFIVGFLVLGMLPGIEKTFDVVTGMTLAELRDPRQPLLRQLQQRAPGTYDHSLQVASISEAAAESIGADALLAYVGGLYHDVGKLNKPEYFIENQNGANRHQLLTPNLSLLVIIGHVKDGVELAKQYGIPKQIINFIKSHHGTSLVEYFFNEAKKISVENNMEIPDESDYRYQGPKPKTKEEVILAIADSIESAARTLNNPNDQRIDRLVKQISRKKLEDGQFDDSQISFNELKLIEDAIAGRIRSIYHQRIAYPKIESTEESKSLSN